MNFDNLTNTQKTELVKAGLKGFAHATVIPLFTIIITNNLFSGNFGGVVAIIYIIAALIFYNKIAHNKDFSKMVFNYTVSIVYGALFGIIGLGILLSAF